MAILTTPYELQVFTVETGEQAIINVNMNHNITFALRSGGTDDINIEIQLKEGGTRTVALATQSGVVVDATIAGVAGIGINIVTNNSNNIEFEVRTTAR